jgi:hypothetical protein
VTREERLARNEALFREINERISEMGERFSTEALDIVCECANDECAKALALSHADYERLRSSGKRFAVAPGHENLEVERVLERHAGYLVVEKVGAGAQVAEQLDPR